MDVVLGIHTDLVREMKFHTSPCHRALFLLFNWPQSTFEPRLLPRMTWEQSCCFICFAVQVAFQVEDVKELKTPLKDKRHDLFQRLAMMSRSQIIAIWTHHTEQFQWMSRWIWAFQVCRFHDFWQSSLSASRFVTIAKAVQLASETSHDIPAHLRVS